MAVLVVELPTRPPQPILPATAPTTPASINSMGPDTAAHRLPHHPQPPIRPLGTASTVAATIRYGQWTQFFLICLSPTDCVCINGIKSTQSENFNFFNQYSEPFVQYSWTRRLSFSKWLRLGVLKSKAATKIGSSRRRPATFVSSSLPKTSFRCNILLSIFVAVLLFRMKRLGHFEKLFAMSEFRLWTPNQCPQRIYPSEKRTLFP